MSMVQYHVRPYFEGTGVIIMMPGTTGCVEVFEARSWPMAGTSVKF